MKWTLPLYIIIIALMGSIAGFSISRKFSSSDLQPRTVTLEELEPKIYEFISSIQNCFAVPPEKSAPEVKSQTMITFEDIGFNQYTVKCYEAPK